MAGITKFYSNFLGSFCGICNSFARDKSYFSNSHGETSIKNAFVNNLVKTYQSSIEKYTTLETAKYTKSVL